MKFKTPQYQARYCNYEDWVSISEKSVLEILLDNFDCITPIIDEMLQGKEICIHDYVYRIVKT
jgi:hypothetical protein